MARPGEHMVRLVDGSEVSTYSEAWRRECEARFVVGMPVLDQEAHLAAIGKKRGPAGELMLRQDMAWLSLAPKAADVLKMPKAERVALYGRLAGQYGDALASRMRAQVVRLYEASKAGAA